MLDLGCGEGAIARALAGAGCIVVAADPSERALGRARAAGGEVDYRPLPAMGALPLEDAEFDLVWCSQVLEGVIDPQGFLSEARRVLRPGGRLALTTAYHGRLRDAARSLWGFEREFAVTGSRLRFFTRRSLTGLLRDFGFGEVQVHGAGGVPLWRQILFASARRSG